MYLRIGIAHEYKPFHQFLWREIDQDCQPDTYQFDRVVFGANYSPFQAQLVLQHHAKKFKDTFPLAAETVLRSTYMDDSMDSVANEDQGIELHRQLSQLLRQAGMHARKWLSNLPRVLRDIPLQDRKAEVDMDADYLPSTKTLGMWWLSDQDVFTFRENAPSSEVKYTKRNFLKQIATLFDPIGLLARFPIRAKMLLQQTWMAGLDWDEELTEPLTNAARAWFRELPELTQLKIPRCLLVGGKQIDNVSLHTFVDASEDAFGAVAYVMYSYQDGTISTNIVAAKTRVGEIQTSINPEQWRYIPTSLNPADKLSRGMAAADLAKYNRWWKGPEFLRKPNEACPTKVIKDNHTGYDDMKRSTRSTLFTRMENSSESVCMVVAGNEDNFPLEPCNYSSFLCLKRVLA